MKIRKIGPNFALFKATATAIDSISNVPLDPINAGITPSECSRKTILSSRRSCFCFYTVRTRKSNDIAEVVARARVPLNPAVVCCIPAMGDGGFDDEFDRSNYIHRFRVFVDVFFAFNHVIAHQIPDDIIAHQRQDAVDIGTREGDEEVPQ